MDEQILLKREVPEPVSCCAKLSDTSCASMIAARKRIIDDLNLMPATLNAMISEFSKKIRQKFRELLHFL